MVDTIIVSGSLSEIRAKLLRMKTVIDNRVTEGYSPVLMDFSYKYNAYRDACPECLPLNGLMYRGPYLASEFPECIQMSMTVWVVDKHGNCRCLLELNNASEACVGLLTRELMEA